jgi:hypothetical protein
MSKKLKARSLTFFDDGENATLSITTEEEGHFYIKITPNQGALLNAELGNYVFTQISKAAQQEPLGD